MKSHIFGICSQKRGGLNEISTRHHNIFVDLVILNVMGIWNIYFKSIFTRQEIDEMFDVNVNNFVDFLKSEYPFEVYVPNTHRV